MSNPWHFLDWIKSAIPESSREGVWEAVNEIINALWLIMHSPEKHSATSPIILLSRVTSAHNPNSPASPDPQDPPRLRSDWEFLVLSYLIRLVLFPQGKPQESTISGANTTSTRQSSSEHSLVDQTWPRKMDTSWLDTDELCERKEERNAFRLILTLSLSPLRR